jgi:hypothetical protein
MEPARRHHAEATGDDMSDKKDDFKAEVSNGWLLIAIKIPTTTCAACGKVYTHEVRPERLQQYVHTGLMSAFQVPWCATPPWGFIQLGKDDGFKRALVCDTCFAPVAKLEAAAEDLKREAHAKVGATVKVWP